jgi:hypothetical protein
MQIESGKTSNFQTKFSSRFMKLLFVISSAHTTVANALTAIRNTKLQLTSTHPSYGTKTRIIKQSLLDLLELNASDEGRIRTTGSTTAYLIKGSLAVSPDGAIVPTEQEQFTLDVEVSGTSLTVDVYAMDVLQDAFFENNYTVQPCFPNSPTSLNVSNASAIGLPKANLVDLEIEMPNGKKVKYLPAELDEVCDEINESIHNENGLESGGTLNLYVIPVVAAKLAHVTYTAQTNAIILRQESI